MKVTYILVILIAVSDCFIISNMGLSSELAWAQRSPGRHRTNSHRINRQRTKGRKQPRLMTFSTLFSELKRAQKVSEKRKETNDLFRRLQAIVASYV